MCGIAGIISFKGPIDPRHIIKMTDIVSYRGPDDYGYLGGNTESGLGRPFKDISETAGMTFNLLLGHRRLSILDLTPVGHQPMSYSNGRYWIIFNGDVYNYLELRADLQQKGYRFKTGTDREVILAAYQEWGVDCVHKFNGMWAFALLDTKMKTWFYARDRLGVKPL
jgi:asparagine synthase (glutamine-hydrolysing)